MIRPEGGAPRRVTWEGRGEVVARVEVFLGPRRATHVGEGQVAGQVAPRRPRPHLRHPQLGDAGLLNTIPTTGGEQSIVWGMCIVYNIGKLGVQFEVAFVLQGI